MRRRTASGVLSISPRKRTSPWRPSSAKATEIFSLEVSRPTNTLLLCGMARPLCGRLGAGPSGTTLARRIVGTSHLRRNEHTVCQIGVFAAYVSDKGHAFIDRRLLADLAADAFHPAQRGPCPRGPN